MQTTFPNLLSQWLQWLRKSEWVIFWWAVTKDDIQQCQIRPYFEWRFNLSPNFHRPEDIAARFTLEIGITVDIPFPIYRRFMEQPKQKSITPRYFSEVFYAASKALEDLR